MADASYIECSRCLGKKIDPDDFYPCTRCAGTGKVCSKCAASPEHVKDGVAYGACEHH